MSVPMVGPGPLEGGPKSLPGPAKSEDTFSGHFKQACDRPQEDSNSSLVPPSEDHSDTPNGLLRSPRLSKGEGFVSVAGPETSSEDGTEPLDGETLLLPNPKGILVSLTANANVEEVLVSAEPDQDGGRNQTTTAEKSLVASTDPSVLLAKPLLEITEKSEPETKEEWMKNQAPPGHLLPPVVAPVPIPLAIVLPAEPSEPILNEPSAIVLNEEPVSVSGVTAAVNVTAPVLAGAMPLAGPKIEGASRALTADVDISAPRKERSETTKKNQASQSVLVDGAKDQTVPLESGLGFSVEPTVKGSRPDSGMSSTEKQGKPSPQDASEAKPVTHTAQGIPPEASPQITVTADVAPKRKETPGISPLGSDPISRSGGDSVPLGKMPIPESSPLAELRPAESVRSAAPVLTPSPVDLARQIHVHLESGRSVVHIELQPDHLGELRISMETKGKDVSMQFTVDNDNARHAVVAGLREITGTLSSLGWSVNGLAVHVSSGGVGNGRGDSLGPAWGQGQNQSNTLPTEPEVSAQKQGAGEWRVDLVA
ncbi:MAG: flagellar hook-length control protein FliK [Elusimicrobia bacterium]|nr:flagellar hook-length control protein FliK [Elusimicrobiota bacterium]